MIEPKKLEGRQQTDVAEPAWTGGRRRLAAMGAVVAALVAVFLGPLLDWAAYAANSHLMSHVLLVPLITGYLIYLRQEELRLLLNRETPGRMQGLIPALAGAAMIGIYWILRWRGVELSRNDALFFLVFGFVSFLLAGAVVILGWNVARTMAFPLLFLLFMAPLPDIAIHGMEVFFQHASAEAAALLFGLASTPVFRDGLFFTLPGLTIEVAEECSGIRSSLVLFLASLLGGYMLLGKRVSRVVFAVAVVPIAIARNAIRIFVIAMLTVHVDPEMIHGPLHRRGGPIFFIASLAPFLVILLALRWLERRRWRRRVELE